MRHTHTHTARNKAISKRREWDTKLDVQKQRNWTEILKDLKAIPDHSIPKYLGFLDEGE